MFLSELSEETLFLCVNSILGNIPYKERAVMFK